MMRFSREYRNIILLLLIILNIIIRIPRSNHEIGVDGFWIHSLATSISTFGFAGWILHPLSFFGVYPMSYSSGGPMILSGVSQVSGISIEYTILLLGMGLGIFSALSSFLLAKEIRNDDLFAFLTAFLYSLSPFFIELTTWQMSTRNIFVAFFPIFLWSLLKIGRPFKLRYSGITLGFFILLFSAHRITFFIPLIIASFILTCLSRHFFGLKIFRKGGRLRKLNLIASIFLLALTFFFIYAEFFSGIPFYALQTDYQSGFFLSGSQSSVMILNMVIDYMSKSGILLIFIYVGYITLLKKVVTINRNELFLLLSVILLTPILIYEDYAPLFVLPFSSLMISLGIVQILKNFNKKSLATSVLVIYLFLSMGFIFFMLNHWQIGKSTIDTTYQTSLFIKDFSDGTSVANSGLVAAQISAFSGKPVLPFGGPYARWHTPEQLVFGFANKTDILVRPSRLTEIPGRREFYTLVKAPDQEADWERIMNADWERITNPNDWDKRHAQKVMEVLSKYNIHLIVEYDLGGSYVYWMLRPSSMLGFLNRGGNRIYHNGKIKIFYLEDK